MTGCRPRLVLTARAENHLHGRDDLSNTVARLQAYEAAGVDVLFAPGLTAAQDIAAVIAAVTAPVSVLLMPSSPSLPELAELGVSRVSTGGAFAFAALGARRRRGSGGVRSAGIDPGEQALHGR